MNENIIIKKFNKEFTYGLFFELRCIKTHIESINFNNNPKRLKRDLTYLRTLINQIIPNSN
jgi:hypothetical protein